MRADLVRAFSQTVESVTGTTIGMTVSMTGCASWSGKSGVIARGGRSRFDMAYNFTIRKLSPAAQWTSGGGYGNGGQICLTYPNGMGLANTAILASLLDHLLMRGILRPIEAADILDNAHWQLAAARLRRASPEILRSPTESATAVQILDDT